MLLPARSSVVCDTRITAKLHELACRRTTGPTGLTHSRKQRCFGDLHLTETWNTAWPSHDRLFSLVTGDGRVWPLDSVKDLHEVRRQLDLAPVGRDAVSWLRVFTFITRSHGGPFMLLDRPRRVARLCGLSCVQAGTTRLSRLCREPVVVDVSRETTQIGARVLHGGGVFDTLFSVGRLRVARGQPRDDWPGAGVVMLDDRLVVTTELTCQLRLACPTLRH